MEDNKIPVEVKNTVIDETSELLKEYSETEAKRKSGKVLRTLAKIGSKFAFILKFVKLNKRT